MISYDDALLSYQFRRDKDYMAWFARQLQDLAHRVKNIISTNVPMAALSKEQWEGIATAYDVSSYNEGRIHFIH